jgi:hypothetical protein
LSRGDDSILREWSARSAPLPAHVRVMELTRGVVHAEYRGIGLYRLLMLETLLRLRSLRADLATAAIELEFFGRRFLFDDLGFCPVGAPVVLHDHPRTGTVVQCIALEVTAELAVRWRAQWARQMERFAATRWEVDSDLAVIGEPSALTPPGVPAIAANLSARPGRGAVHSVRRP